MRIPRLLAVPLLALLGVAAPAPALAADEPQTWAVVPATTEGPDGRGDFSYVAQPGFSTVDYAAVRNFGTSPLTVELSVQDATQSADGTFTLLEADEEPNGIGSWLHLDHPEVTVPARSSLVVSFTLDVPADAEPGDHAGGVIAVSAVEQADGSAVQYRVGSRVHVRVGGAIDASLALESPGGRYDLAAGPFAPGELALDVTAANTGNLRLTPSTTARAESLFGWWSAELPVDVGELLPGSAVERALVFGDVPAFGPLTITIDAGEVSSRNQDVSDATTVQSTTVVVWAIPWSALVGLAALVLVLVTLVVVRRRRSAARA